jgi:hypothetical protein
VRPSKQHRENSASDCRDPGSFPRRGHGIFIMIKVIMGQIFVRILSLVFPYTNAHVLTRASAHTLSLLTLTTRCR